MDASLRYILTASVLAFGCGTATQPLDLLVLITTIDSTTLTLGNQAWLTVAAFNPTRTEIRFDGSSACILRYQLLDSAGRRLPAPYGCDDAQVFYGVAPGDTMVRHWRWRGETVDTITYRVVRLAPGRYRLRAVLDATQGVRLGPSVEVELRAAGP